MCQVWNVKVLLDSDSRSMFFYQGTQSCHRLQYLATIADKGSTIYAQYIFKRALSWWCHQIQTFCALLALCAGNSPVTGEFPSQRPVTRSFDVFFYLSLNKPLSKQLWGWWLEAPSRSLWRHCNDSDTSWASWCLKSFILSTAVITKAIETQSLQIKF